MPSNGQLMAMEPEEREAAIAALPAETRLALAELASLGLRRNLHRFEETDKRFYLTEAQRLSETLVALTKTLYLNGASDE